MSHDLATTTPGPVDIVLAWWQAIQDKDMDALARLLDGDHISTGGPAGRTVGNAAALAEVEMFLANGIVDTWSVNEVLLRDHGEAVVCSYAWEETGRHLDIEFKMSGHATDVMARSATGWKISAHHTSVTPSAI